MYLSCAGLLMFFTGSESLGLSESASDDEELSEEFVVKKRKHNDVPQRPPGSRSNAPRAASKKAAPSTGTSKKAVGSKKKGKQVVDTDDEVLPEDVTATMDVPQWRKLRKETRTASLSAQMSRVTEGFGQRLSNFCGKSSMMIRIFLSVEGMCSPMPTTLTGITCM